MCQIYTFARIGEYGKWMFLCGTSRFSLTKSCSCSKETVKSHFVFWFIFKEFASVPRVKFPFCYSKTKCQNKFWLLALALIFLFIFCFVLSYLFIMAYIWQCSEHLFFSDFCSSNVCFLSVASGEQKLLFMVWQKHLTFWHQCCLKQLGLRNKRGYYFWM